MMSDNLKQVMVDCAVERATSELIRFVGANCHEMNADEGRFMVGYMQDCQKKMNEEIDKAIERFKSWR